MADQKKSIQRWRLATGAFAAAGAIATSRMGFEMHDGEFGWDQETARNLLTLGTSIIATPLAYMRSRRFDNPGWYKENGSTRRPFGWLAASLGVCAFAMTVDMQEAGNTPQPDRPPTTSAPNEPEATQPVTTEPAPVDASANIILPCPVELPFNSGDVGSEIEWLEGMLSSAGYETGPVDRDQDEVTDAAVLQFKVDNEFDPNATFDAAMCRTLMSIVAPPGE